MKLLVISILIGLRLSATIQADVECEEPEPPSNGRKAKLNATRMIYYCNKGFVLHGNSTSDCVDGEWSPSGQICEEFIDVPKGWMGCGKPGHPLNGYRYIEKMEENKLTYACNVSYALVGHRVRRCQENGTWTPEIPICVKTNISNEQLIDDNPPALDENDSNKFEVGMGLISTCMILIIAICLVKWHHGYRKRKNISEKRSSGVMNDELQQRGEYVKVENTNNQFENLNFTKYSDLLKSDENSAPIAYADCSLSISSSDNDHAVNVSIENSY